MTITTIKDEYDNMIEVYARYKKDLSKLNKGRQDERHTRELVNKQYIAIEAVSTATNMLEDIIELYEEYNEDKTEEMKKKLVTEIGAYKNFIYMNYLRFESLLFE